jgi:putative protease
MTAPKKATKKVAKKTAKKAVKKAASAKPKQGAKKVALVKAKEKLKEVGKVVHYFDKISVAVIRLTGAIKVGDTIRIEGGQNTDFKQQVKSMEFDHKKIVKAVKGQEVGLEVKEVVRDGYKVYKV